MIEILDPTVEPGPRPLAYAPRPASLAGARVALVENTKFNSDRLLAKLGEILTVEYGAAGVRMWRKRHASAPVSDEMIAEIRAAADVMVAGIGD